MPSPRAKYAYDASTGEHVLLGRTNAPQRESFTPEALAKQDKQRKRRERKQRQRARKRAEKQAQPLARDVQDPPDAPEPTPHPPDDTPLLATTLHHQATAHLHQHRDAFTTQLLHTVRHVAYQGRTLTDDDKKHVQAACVLLRRQGTTLATLAERCSGHAGQSVWGEVNALYDELCCVGARMEAHGASARRVREVAEEVSDVGTTHTGG